jgi:hypothetical protein
MAQKISNLEIFKNLLGMQSKVVERLLCDVEILRKELAVYKKHEEYDEKYDEEYGEETKTTKVVMTDPLKKLGE